MAETQVPATETTEGSESQGQTTGREAAQGQDDFNAARARKQIKTLAKQLEDAQKALQERTDAEKSETEKAIEAARKEGRQQMESELAKLRIDHSLETELLRRGLDPDLKYVVLAKGEIAEEGDIAGAVDDVLGKREWLKPRPVGAQGMPSRDARGREFPRGGAWDRAQVQEVMARGLMDEYREEIQRFYGVRK